MLQEFVDRCVQADGQDGEWRPDVRALKKIEKALKKVREIEPLFTNEPMFAQ